MQPKDLELIATATELNEQILPEQRQPYLAPSLVRLDLTETQAATGIISDGITVTS